MWVLWHPTSPHSQLSFSVSLWSCACAWAKLSAASDKSHTKSNQTIKVVVVQTTLVTPPFPWSAYCHCRLCLCLPNATQWQWQIYAPHVCRAYPGTFIPIAIHSHCNCLLQLQCATHTCTLGHGLYLQLKCGRQSVAYGLIAKSRERSRNAPREREGEIGSDVEIARELEKGEQSLHKWSEFVMI